MKSGDLSNAFAKHLREDHPDADARQVENVLEFDVIRTFEKPLERQVAEAVAIHSCKADKLLNSKSEWEQPAVERLVVTRDLPEAVDVGVGRGRGRGRRQRGADQ